jgi:hypothetical protein
LLKKINKKNPSYNYYNITNEIIYMKKDNKNILIIFCDAKQLEYEIAQW